MQSFTLHRKPSFSYAIRILVFIAALFLLCRVLSMSVNSSKEQEKLILEQALNRTITQCYALEGEYPQDIAYLTEHYGLTYNHDSFLVDYEFIAGNIRPDITIIERK